MKKMLNAIKSVRNHHPLTLISSPFTSQIVRRTSGVSFRQAAAAGAPNQPENLDNMAEQTENPNTKTGDVMYESFGEVYATRSEEEGFGVISGSKQRITEEEDKNTIHENHPDDKSQGSHVKEKEKAPNQQSASS